MSAFYVLYYVLQGSNGGRDFNFILSSFELDFFAGVMDFFFAIMCMHMYADILYFISYLCAAFSIAEYDLKVSIENWIRQLSLKSVIFNFFIISMYCLLLCYLNIIMYKIDVLNIEH